MVNSKESMFYNLDDLLKTSEEGLRNLITDEQYIILKSMGFKKVKDFVNTFSIVFDRNNRNIQIDFSKAIEGYQSLFSDRNVKIEDNIIHLENKN